MIPDRKRRQCAKCPWKKGTDPTDIPGEYCEARHKNLAGTIATPGEFRLTTNQIRMMACHETKPGKEMACVGWLAHQLGPGNNITLRMMAAAGQVEGYDRFLLDGTQHEHFEDTLPR